MVITVNYHKYTVMKVDGKPVKTETIITFTTDEENFQSYNKGMFNIIGLQGLMERNYKRLFLFNEVEPVINDMIEIEDKKYNIIAIMAEFSDHKEVILQEVFL